MEIKLSDHFTYKKLIRFVIPSIVMMIFTSIYGVVDGLCVSNFVGKTPFAGLNLIMPFIMVLGAFGFMLGAGGSALVAKTLGEGDNESAQRYFTMLIMLVLPLPQSPWIEIVIGVTQERTNFVRPATYCDISNKSPSSLSTELSLLPIR